MKSENKKGYYCDIEKPATVKIVKVGINQRLYERKNVLDGNSPWSTKIPCGEWEVYETNNHIVTLRCTTKPRFNVVSAWWSNLFGFCPQCNSDAPAIDNCPVCKNDRDRDNPDKKYWWSTYKILRFTKDKHRKH